MGLELTTDRVVIFRRFVSLTVNALTCIKTMM